MHYINLIFNIKLVGLIMILKKGNGLLLTCVCILAGASSAYSLDKSITEDVFITAKAGIVSPASALDGNSGLNIGGSTETFGLVVGKKFMERYIIDAEYSYRGENNTGRIASLIWIE